MVSGLHCPPCTHTVESSLAKAKGIRAFKVNWKTKKARGEFDEHVVTAQQVARLIADTPHMMGRHMHYAGWLALRASEIKDEASAKRAQAAVSKIKGIKRVATYPAQLSIGVLFDENGELSTQQLITGLRDEGFQATAF